MKLYGEEDETCHPLEQMTDSATQLQCPDVRRGVEKVAFDKGFLSVIFFFGFFERILDVPFCIKQKFEKGLGCSL